MKGHHICDKLSYPMASRLFWPNMLDDEQAFAYREAMLGHILIDSLSPPISNNQTQALGYIFPKSYREDYLLALKKPHRREMSERKRWRGLNEASASESAG